MAEALTQSFSVADSGEKAKAVASAVGGALHEMGRGAQAAMVGEAVASFNDLADGGQCGLAAATAFGAAPPPAAWLGAAAWRARFALAARAGAAARPLTPAAPPHPAPCPSPCPARRDVPYTQALRQARRRAPARNRRRQGPLLLGAPRAQARVQPRVWQAAARVPLRALHAGGVRGVGVAGVCIQLRAGQRQAAGRRSVRAGDGGGKGHVQLRERGVVGVHLGCARGRRPALALVQSLHALHYICGLHAVDLRARLRLAAAGAQCPPLPRARPHCPNARRVPPPPAPPRARARRPHERVADNERLPVRHPQGGADGQERAARKRVCQRHVRGRRRAGCAAAAPPCVCALAGRSPNAEARRRAARPLTPTPPHAPPRAPAGDASGLLRDVLAATAGAVRASGCGAAAEFATGVYARLADQDPTNRDQLLAKFSRHPALARCRYDWAGAEAALAAAGGGGEAEAAAAGEAQAAAEAGWAEAEGDAAAAGEAAEPVGEGAAEAPVQRRRRRGLRGVGLR